MNNSKFTTAQLRLVLPILLTYEVGVTQPIGTELNSTLCELSFKEPIIITSVDEDKGMLLIRFEQHFDDEDGFGEVWRYETLQTIPDVEHAFNR